MRTNILFFIALLMSGAGGQASLASAATSARAGGDATADRPVEPPPIWTDLKIHKNTFEHSTRIVFKNGDIEQIRKIILDARFLDDVNSWISKASYKNMTVETLKFDFSINYKDRDLFSLSFDCREANGDRTWSLVCVQNNARSSEDSSIVNAKRTAICQTEDEEIEPSVVCDFHSVGEAKDYQKFWMTLASAQKIAFSLFFEDTSYLGHVSLRASNFAHSTDEAKRIFHNRYGQMLADLQAQKPDFAKKLSDEMHFAASVGNATEAVNPTSIENVIGVPKKAAGPVISGQKHEELF